MYECVKPGTDIRTDEHKSYFWLGKTNNAITYQPNRPALQTNSTELIIKKIQDCGRHSY